MEYRTPGDTEIKVSVICLGTMTFGEQNTEAQAHAQLELAVEPDVNFINRVEMCAVPAQKETQGLSERYIGVSNETLRGVTCYPRHSEASGVGRIVSVQNPYNMLNRSFEVGLTEFAHRDQVGLPAYSPLGFGVLRGKYLGGASPAGARLTRWRQYFPRYITEQAKTITQQHVDVAANAGLDPAQMALAYVNSRGFVTANIIGATSLEQLSANIESVGIKLSLDVIDAIETLHNSQPNPRP